MSAIDRFNSAIRDDFQLAPLVAAELEFVLHGAPDDLSCSALHEIIQQAGLSPHKVEKEQGRQQYEVALLGMHPAWTCRNIVALKSLLQEYAAARGMQADFSAKPFADQPGNGMHIHIDLINRELKSAFFKQDAVISDALKHSIGGLLHWMLPSMPVFAPHEESYARFVGQHNAPTNVSWGANNRTVALRLPDAPEGLRHIEHRVAGSDTDPGQVIALILAAIHDGLGSKYALPEQVYGDAALEQYALPKFPTTLDAAWRLCENSELCDTIREVTT
ncbi:MAG: hypothetical protein AB7L92_04425 [Alphaproteobacteria bacterium]